MSDSNVLQAFQAASGISTKEISLMIRSLVYSLFLLWAVWILQGQYQLIQSKSLDIFEWPLKILRILLLCALVMILVYVN